MPYLRLHRAPDAADAAPGSPIVFTAATGGRKADGLDLTGLPWDLSRAVNGDVGPRFPFLWVHDLGGDNLPLGIAEVTSDPDELPLRVAVTCDPEDEFAQRVERKYRSPVGGLSAVSISWDDMDADGMPARISGKKAVAHQLLEVSAVPVPLDADALKEGARQALRALREDLDAVLTDDTDVASADVVDLTGTSEIVRHADGSVTLDGVTYAPVGDDDGLNAGRSRSEDDEWAEVAAAMVDLYDRGTSAPDGVRQRTYKALKRVYQRLNRTWPEWVPGAELKALDDDNWRALFLAGELEASGIRAGAELSRQNMQELSDVRDAMGECVKRVSALLDRVASKQSAKAEDAGDDADTARSTVGVDLAAIAAWLDNNAAKTARGNDDD